MSTMERPRDLPPPYTATPTDTIKADNWTEEPPATPPLERIRERQQESNKAVKIIAAYGCMICCLPILLGVGVAMVVLGVVNMERCPLEPRIPILLIVYGSIYLFLCLGRFIMKSYQVCCKEDTLKDKNFCEKLTGVVFFLVGLGLFVINIVFCVFVFVSPRPTFDDPDGPRFCDRRMYMFTLVYLFVTLVVIGLHVMMFCCICSCLGALQCYFCCKSRKRVIRQRNISRAELQRHRPQTSHGANATRPATSTVHTVPAPDAVEIATPQHVSVVLNDQDTNNGDDSFSSFRPPQHTASEWKREAMRRAEQRF